ncbi:hypothetical protein AM571_CH01458 [Rhizobium etli 8C-3]|uniref:Uncharacterized protein n=1 Tax=Rhizobium etli 8C-3 TaxID=538025 RepID=A0A1L5P2C1_RHIET|nr:hypothetical protein [Rhizobium etli]APO74293.1 hypothetical protein AM571_CH01458 [Rhizobium etli 8C-3]
MLQETDRIQARGESGRIYTVIERTKIISMRMLDGSVSQAKGTKQLSTADGQHVNWIDENTFQIVLTDEILHRIT